MPAGELFIVKTNDIVPVNNSLESKECGGMNNVFVVDMFKQYGASFTESSLSSLMTPAANKSYVENVSRLQHGKRMITNKAYVKKESREISLEMWITASSRTDFWQKYERFCDEILDNGKFILFTRYSSKVFKLVYQSCGQFSEFVERIAKFTLRCIEQDPTDRVLTEADFAFEVEESSQETEFND